MFGSHGLILFDGGMSHQNATDQTTVERIDTWLKIPFFFIYDTIHFFFVGDGGR